VTVTIIDPNIALIVIDLQERHCLAAREIVDVLENRNA